MRMKRHMPERATESGDTVSGYWVSRKNYFLGRWIGHGGFWPDPKLRLFRQGYGRFEERSVHEIVKVDGNTAKLKNVALLHHSYPTLSDYIEHMNRYSSLGAEMVVAKGNGKVRFSVINIVLRPLATFIYNYFFRLGFLDGREGLLLHLYHAVYVSWKYAKAWELSRKNQPCHPERSDCFVEDEAVMESKDPFHLSGARGPSRSSHETSLSAAEESALTRADCCVGVRDPSAAQDDTF